MTVEGSELPASGNQQGGPGRILAEQREALGWSVEQVADQLKLAVRQVVAIETGDYASLPPAAVVRGFVRAYAKVLRLDPAPLVSMIPLDTPPVDSAAVAARREKAAAASMSQVRFSSSGARRRLPWGAIGGAVAAVAIGVAVWQLAPMVGMFGAQNNHAATTSALPPPAVPGGNVVELPSPVAGAPAAPTAPAGTGSQVGSLQNPSVPLISVPPQSQPSAPGATGTPAAPPAAGAVPATATTSATATAATAPAAAPASAPAAGGDALVLTVKEDSWIEVRRAKGKPLLSKLVKAGSTETVEIKEPVTLVVGNAAGVEATLRGAALPLPPTSGTVARLPVQ
jgi:cytoskeleton protein RodZ